MRLYRLLLDSRGNSMVLTLKSLLYETDLSDAEVDSIASMMVGDTLTLDSNEDGYLAVRRVVLE